ncbi:MAG: DUF5801 repeats-in-toxin domain-containing protein [Paracoccaceae bacterium]
MTIEITVNGDFTLDESAGLQNSSLPPEAPAGDKDDEDILRSGLPQDFKDLLDSIPAGLFDSFPDTDGERAAESQANLITVTSDGVLTGISLTGEHTDDNGTPADPSDDTATALVAFTGANFGAGGGTGLTTTDGNDILLYSDVLIDPDGVGGNDPFLAAEAEGLTGNVVFGIEETTGDIVFVIYMEETVIDDGEIQLQFSMVTYEAIQHDTANPDESINLGNFLSLSVTETTGFDFSNAPAGKSLFLMAEATSGSTAVVVTSNAEEVEINTSKAQDTTIGWGSQGLNAGETIVLTFVEGNLDSDFIIPNLDQNEADDKANIVFDSSVAVDSGSFEIAQKVGSATAAVKLRAYDADPVDGTGFFTELTGNTAGQTVDFSFIRVENSAGTRAEWTGGDADATGDGVTIDFVTAAEAAGDPDLFEGDIIITGLDEFDTVFYGTDAILDRLWITGVSGTVDIGAITVNEAGGAVAPIGGAFLVEDDGPTADIVLTGVTVVHDESAGEQTGGSPPGFPEDNNDDDQAGAAPDAITQFEADEGIAADRLGWAMSSGAVVDTSGTDFGADDEFDADGAGGDAPDGIDLELVLSGEGADSGLTVLSGMGISLYTQTVTVDSVEITLVVGRVNAEDVTVPIDPRGDADPTGEVAFVIYLDQDGNLSTAQYLELRNPDGDDPDDQVQIQCGVLFAKVTATDRDGDTDTAMVDLGDDPATIPGEDATDPDPEISANNEAVVRFEDDGPTAGAASGPTTIEEEDLDNSQSVGIDDDSSVTNYTATKDLGALITDPGVDLPLSFGFITTTTFDDPSDNPDLGAVEVAIDDTVLGALIAGEAGYPDTSLTSLAGLTSKGDMLTYSISYDVADGVDGLRDVLTATAGGRTVFTFELVTKQDTNGTDDGGADDGPAAGTIIFTLEDQVDHADEGDNPTGDPLGQNSLTVDFDDLLAIVDDDDDSVSLPGEAEYVIEDDVPTIGPIDDFFVEFATDATGMGSVNLNAVAGADEDPSFDITAYTGDGGDIVIGDVTLTAEKTSDTLITYFVDANGNDVFDDGAANLYYTYELVDTDADTIVDSAKFTVHHEPPPANLGFDLNELPSGQNLFGILAGKAPGETDVDPDGPALIIVGRDPGDTINTSHGGGPTTIGNSNQMINAISNKDPDGEGVFFAYVLDPEDSYVSGILDGLDQNEADVAANIQYNGGTVEVDGAAFDISQTQGKALAELRISAWDVPGSGLQGQSFVDDPIAGATQVEVTAVRVFDGDTLVFSDVEGGGVDFVLAGFEAITVDFNAAGATDSAVVTGLDAGYTIEFDTALVHDVSLIEGLAGKFDIGGFSISEPTPTDDQSFDFTVEITDFDGDTNSASHSVGIDGTGVNNDDLII